MTRGLTSAEVLDLAQQAHTRAAFRAEVLSRLQRHLGSDIAIFHEFAPAARDMGSVIGVSESFFERAREANGSEYVNEVLGAIQGGRTVVDAELFGRQRLWRFSFYDEILRPTGVSSVLYGLVQFRGLPPAFLAFGRASSRGPSHFPPGVLESLIPPLTLADAALANMERFTPLVPRDELTPRQRELVSYVGLGLTNPMIAAAMDISPHTVRNLLAALFARHGVSNRAELLRVVYEDVRGSWNNRTALPQGGGRR